MGNNVAKQFFEMHVGSQVSDGASVYRVTHLLSTDSVLAVDLATQETQRLHVEKLRVVAESSAEAAVGGAANDQELLAYSDREWLEAQRRFEAIKPLLDNPGRSKREVAAIAASNKVHVVTLYRWVKSFLAANHVSALVPERRGRKAGTRMLEQAAEAIIESVIERDFLNKQRLTPQSAIEEVTRLCRLAGVTPPHPNTVRNRIHCIPCKVVLRRRGYKKEAEKLRALRGNFPGADHPLAVVQIDHTPADIICVDEVSRQPIGRPFLTLAIDIDTRMIVGLYLSYDPPSAASVGLCIAQAICPKREYLANLGVPGNWPVWGRMGTIHCDNAKEFRGTVLSRACQEYGIDLNYRPVKTPRYGGHIERLVGTSVREMHKLPGTTFSNPRMREGYDADAQSAFTLRELEQHLVDFFVNVYHQRVHSALGMSPLRKWELGIAGDGTKPGLGMMPLPQDPERVRLDFMPFVERTVQPYGLQIDNICYYDPVLDPYINAVSPGDRKKKQSFVVRRDPRDISRVHFFDPTDKRYYTIPYRDIGHPPMSLYELREVLRRLADEGCRDINEHVIFEALERARARVEQATQKSRAARRKAARSPARAPVAAPTGPRPAPTAPMPVQAVSTCLATAVEDDPFALPVLPFDVDLKR